MARRRVDVEVPKSLRPRVEIQDPLADPQTGVRGAAPLAQPEAPPPSRKRVNVVEPLKVTGKRRRVDIVPPVTGVDVTQLKKDLVLDEGERLDIYTDKLKRRTVGIGHLLLPSDPEFNQKIGTKISSSRVNELFNFDVAKHLSEAKRVVPDLESHPESVQRAIVNMTFQLGAGNLSQFKKTLSLINSKEYTKAAEEAKDSEWFKQTPNRAKRVLKLIEDAQNEPHK